MRKSSRERTTTAEATAVEEPRVPRARGGRRTLAQLSNFLAKVDSGEITHYHQVAPCTAGYNLGICVHAETGQWHPAPAVEAENLRYRLQVPPLSELLASQTPAPPAPRDRSRSPLARRVTVARSPLPRRSSTAASSKAKESAPQRPKPVVAPPEPPKPKGLFIPSQVRASRDSHREPRAASAGDRLQPAKAKAGEPAKAKASEPASSSASAIAKAPGQQQQQQQRAQPQAFSKSRPASASQRGERLAPPPRRARVADLGVLAVDFNGVLNVGASDEHPATFKTCQAFRSLVQAGFRGAILSYIVTGGKKSLERRDAAERCRFHIAHFCFGHTATADPGAPSRAGVHLSIVAGGDSEPARGKAEVLTQWGALGLVDDKVLNLVDSLRCSGVIPIHVKPPSRTAYWPAPPYRKFLERQVGVAYARDSESARYIFDDFVTASQGILSSLADGGWELHRRAAEAAFEELKPHQ